MDIKKALNSVTHLILSGRTREAMERCKKILKKRPDNAPAWHLLGVIYLKRGEYDVAEKHIRKALLFDPAYADAYFNLGNICQDRKQFVTAIGYYRKALQHNPQSAMIYYELGNSLHHEWQLDEAIASYRKALQLNLRSFELYNNLGVALQAKGKFEEAITCYRQAVQLNPAFPGVFNNMGIVAQAQGRLDEAIAYYKKAIDLKQDSPDPWCNLGMLLRERGLFDEAISYFKKAIETDKECAWAYTNMGIALDNKDQIDEAKSYFRRAFDFIPKANDRYAHIIEIVQNKTNIESAPNSLHQWDGKLVLISVCAFNRKKITQLSLAQIIRYKTSCCHLQVYNDHSTEYDNAFLADYANEVIQLPNNMGVNDLRWHQFRMFLERDFDLLYMTDNDGIHDPHFVPMLKRLYEMGEGKFPVTIYNNIHTMRPHMILSHKDGIIIKTMAPGNSMLYDKTMVSKILEVSDNSNHAFDYLPWDNRAVVCLGLPWLSTEASYIEHYGAQGINNDNYDKDRAILPTQYLRERRQSILSYLESDSPLEIFW